MSLLNNNRKEIRIQSIVICMLAVIILSLMTPATANAANSTVTINDPDCSGKLTDLDWTFDFDPDIDIKFGGRKILGVPIPSLILGVNIEIGVKGKFDLDLKRGNLPANTTLDSKIDEDTIGIYKIKMSDNLYEQIPDALGTDYEAAPYFMAGSTGPVVVKGNFSNSTKIRISTDSFSLQTNPKTEFISVRPKTPNRETIFFVGTNFRGHLALGVFNLYVGKVGPILTGTVGSFGGGMGKATLKKDERAFPMHMPDDVDVIHSCTENGREGCVSGIVKEVKDKYADVRVDFSFVISMPFFPDIGVDIFNKRWPVDHNYTSYNQSNFVQSLTWKENLKKQRECSHMYYKVPVAVWADQEKTVGIKGAHIHVKGGVGVDYNVGMYSMDTTGDAEDLPSNRANLYLPYKDGKYTIVAEKDDVEGEGEQPANMVKGANDQVDIIPIGGTYVKYTAKKKWDIDFEDNDRPEKIEVLLQSLHYNQGYWQWQGVEKAELSANNGWTAEFQEVPKYELDRNGKKQEIKYRIRELKEEEGGNNDQGNVNDQLDLDNEVGFLDQADGLMRPAANGDDQLSKDCGRVVLSDWDFDNIHVWKQLKNRVTDWNQLWQLSPSMSFLKSFGTQAFFPTPTVTYNVDEYTTIVGERVEKHKTKYQVAYEEEGTTTTITNTAMLNNTIYKRWIMLGDAETPKSVYLALCYRPQEEYRQHFGGAAAERYAGLWLPVIKPLSGNMINILNLVGADTLAKFDIFNFLAIPAAVGKAKAPGEYENPLVAWRVKFSIKKYGWLTIPGIPIELQGAELSSVILTDVVKYLTGMDIPVSFSLNPFSGDKYITVPGKAYQIPVIDKDWERTSNVINTWIDLDSEDSDTKAIGGIKHWVNDKAEYRPDSLTIIVKDGEMEVGRVTINKNDNNETDENGDTVNKNDWAWSLKSSEAAEGVTLDPDKTYTISEEYPDGFANKDKYVCKVEGHDLHNTWAGDKAPKIVIRKIFEGEPSGSVTIRLYDDQGVKINEKVVRRGGQYGTEKEETITVTEGDVIDGEGHKVQIKGREISKFRVEEILDSSAEGTWKPVYNGPETKLEEDKTPVYTFTIRNRSLKDRVKIDLEKTWSGDDENSRPDSVTVKVLRDQELAREVVLKKEDDWKASVDQDKDGNPLMTINPDTGDNYVYSLEEVEADGYMCTFSEGASSETEKTVQENGQNVTYKETTRTFKLKNEWTGGPGFVTVKGRKIWEDDDNADGKRPESIRINIISGDGGVARELDVSGSGNEWEWSAPGLPRYDGNGDEIQYSVVEGTAQTGTDKISAGIRGYKESYSKPVFDEQTRIWTCDITNSNKICSVAASKKWDDNDNEMGLRPDCVTIRLFRQSGNEKTEIETAELDEENGWTYLFDSLPTKDENGDAYSYAVEEDEVEAYSTEISGSVEDGFTITNKVNENRANIPVTKIWEGDDDVKSGRPSSLTVHLLDGNGNEADSIELTESGNWKGVFKGVKITDEDGHELTYSVSEDPVSGYDEAVIAGSAKDGFTITNTFNNRINVTVKKVWDHHGQDSQSLPGRLPFKLYRKVPGGDQEPVPDNQMMDFLNYEDGWKKVFPNLEKFNDDNIEYQYFVKESVTPYGYKPSFSESRGTDGITLTITNSLVTRSIAVRKVWDDDNNAHNSRPEKYTIHLLTDGQVQEGSTRVLLNGNLDTEFYNLPVFEEDGETMIQYTVEEDPVEGYTTTVTGNMADGFTITNTYNREKKSVTVTKKWEDNHNKNNNRPEKITIHLLADGRDVQTKEMEKPSGSEDTDTWTFVFEDVDVFKGGTDTGQPVIYSVREEPVPGYSSRVNGLTITNTENKLSIPVTKVWKDEGHSESRPEKIVIRLYVNGIENQNYTRSIGSGNNWSLVYSNLPTHKNGADISYEIEEDAVTHYRTSITGSAAEGFTITNTWIPDTTKRDIAVEKVWLDEGGEHPPVTIVLESDFDGKDIFREVDRKEVETPEGDDSVMVVFPDKQIRKSGRVIQYRVKEEPLDGYGDPYIFGTGYYFEITNWKYDGINVLVSKKWVDKDNESGRRPGSITVRLFMTDNTGAEVELDSAEIREEDEWRRRFAIPEEEIANAVSYRISEDEVEGYKTSVTEVFPADSSGRVYACEITNTLQAKTEVPVITKKVKEKHDGIGRESDWQDAADYDIGDRIPYRIEGTLPSAFADYNSYPVYTITDRLSAGLNPPAPEQISIKKNGRTDISDKFNIEFISSDSGQFLTISLKEGEDMRAWTGQQEMKNTSTVVVEYEAVLNENAVTGSQGNPNEVTLTYTTDPGTGPEGSTPTPPETTLPDLVTVFTYAIRVDKTDESGGSLEGAGFTLFKKVNNDWTQVGDEKSGSSAFIFNGVDTGEYRIRETTVPPGYTEADDVDITVIGTYDVEADIPQLKSLTVTPPSSGFTVNVSEQEAQPGTSGGSPDDPAAPDESSGPHVVTDGVVTGAIINRSSSTLPSTGGPGTGTIYLAGALFVIAASAMIYARRKMQQKD